MSKTQEIALVALFTALMCVLAPLSVPIGPIPISLGSFVVYLIGALLSIRDSLFSVFLYLVLGTIGLPVFSGFEGGVAKLFGPTGGFLLGFLLCAFIESLLIRLVNKKWMVPVSMVAGTVFLYAFGLLYFLFYMKDQTTFSKAMMACVVPFLPGDSIKIVLATILAYVLKPLLLKTLETKSRRTAK